MKLSEHDKAMGRISDATLRVQSGWKNRKQHLVMIRIVCRAQGVDAALCYWLNNCPRISRMAFNKAVA